MSIATTFLLIYITYKRRVRKQELRLLNFFCSWHDISSVRLMSTGTCRVRTTAVDNCTINASLTAAVFEVVPQEDRVGFFSQTSEGMYRGNRVILRVCQPQSLHITKKLLNEVKMARSVVGEHVLEMTGISTGPERIAVLYSYSSKGSISVNDGKNAIPK